MSDDDDFKKSTKLGVSAPCYVRKVDTLSCCGDPEKDTIADRTSKIVQYALSDEDTKLSFFYVASSQDVARAAMALNHRRTGTANVFDLCFIAFTEEELKGLPRVQTKDQFVCLWAQQNHWDITFSESDKQRVANSAAQQKRQVRKLTRPTMKQTQAAMLTEGCRSVGSQLTNCVCEAESKANSG